VSLDVVSCGSVYLVIPRSLDLNKRDEWKRVLSGTMETIVWKGGEDDDESSRHTGSVRDNDDSSNDDEEDDDEVDYSDDSAESSADEVLLN
jgi:hypothetical protein